MKRDAATEMKGVCQAIRSDVPSLGEPWLDFGIWIEASEAVEQIADRSAGGDVGGQGGVERPRIVIIARVDDLMTRWGATGTASDDDERCGKTEQWSHAFH